MNPDVKARVASAPAFTVQGVKQAKEGIVVLRAIDLQIPEGRVTALIGPSAAGKTSLLRLLNRLDDPTCGDIFYRSRPVTEYPIRELRQRIGFVFQTPVMFPGSVNYNLREAALVSSVAERDIPALIEESMKLVQLDGSLGERSRDQLSVGQKQRANIARALMTSPEVLLMDEPTGALDPETADRLLQTIRWLTEGRALTIVFATHRLFEARKVSDYTVMLDQGTVVEAGATAEVLERPADSRTKRFLSHGG